MELEVQGYCKAATIEEIAKHDYIPTPGRDVGIEEEKMTEFPLKKRWRPNCRII